MDGKGPRLGSALNASASIRAGAAFASACILAFAASAGAQTAPRLVEYVNPLIGTAPMPDKEFLGNNPSRGEELYYGTVNPGAMVPDPNGFLQVGPVTGFDGCCAHVRGSGYRYDDASIMGFTHINGEYSDQNKLSFMPTVGAIKTAPGSRANPGQGYRSLRDTLREKASAGYYTVFLTTYGIKVELTASKNCGFQRYTFPASQQANVLIDLANCRPGATDASVTLLDGRTIEGFQASGGNVYFRAVFSKDFSASGTWKGGALAPGSASASGIPLGAYASFATTAGEAISVKVGVSTISQAQAAANLAQEIPGMDFDAVRTQAEALWDPILKHVTLEGGSEGDRMNFYTSVYRMAAGPWYSWFPLYTTPGMILARGWNWVSQRTAGMAATWGGGYWGTGRVSSVVGLSKMGFSNINVKNVYPAARAAAMTGGGQAGDAYRKYGYIPPNSGSKPYVTNSIAYAYDDYATAELAKLAGNAADYDLFLARSKNYKKLYNPATGFLTPRNADGSWILPLDPAKPYAEDVYREGDAWNYLWYQMGDIPGLIELIGDTTRFVAKLDTFFTSKFNPSSPLRDLTGVLGQYFHGNEQYRYLPYLYNYAGQPWKTQALVRKIMKQLHRPVPTGLCGMDDYGGLTGWYVSSALGYSIVDRATGYYDIGSPLFPKATLTLEGPNAGTFIIQADNVSDANMYIQSATLNGKPLNVPRFRQNDMIAGGSLIFSMGPNPNKQWGLGGTVAVKTAEAALDAEPIAVAYRSGILILELRAAPNSQIAILDSRGRQVAAAKAPQSGRCRLSLRQPAGTLLFARIMAPEGGIRFRKIAAFE
jgi:putative alpha-1,2-mannosidase